ncbi:MAG: glutathione transferase GstA [Methylomonas sp.]|nr:glutathione transferase GstA [Methylomonas sp.]
MKLYYTPGACSLSPHIVLSEAGFTYELEKVDLKTKQTEHGEDFNAINPKSVVPVLELDDGERLTEGVAIVQYLADLKPEARLLPLAGTLERVRVQEWLNFVATELHKGMHPIYRAADAGEQARDFYLPRFKAALSYVAGQLQGKTYLMGEQFTVADAYLFTVLGWLNWINLDLSEWPVLQVYQQRVAARPNVKSVLGAEGLLA